LVIVRLVEVLDGGLHRSTGGRFFAWVFGGALESAIAADWLTSTWDQNAALAACSPAAAVAEEFVGRWLKDLLRIPEEASFALTTGCQMAHVTCLAAARHSVLQRVNWNVERQGLSHAPPITVISNKQRHGSIDRAVRLLGLGSDCIHEIPTDAGGRILVNAFANAVRSTSGPRIAVLCAGDINTGCSDHFSELIPLAKENDVWIHIDGAFGLMAQASESKRHQLNGVDEADSWATDGHKWLNVPFDCGFAFVRDSESHRDSMSGGGSYVASATDSRDQIDWNPEWSRRARGFAVYAALLELSRNGLEQLIDRCCRFAARLVDGIAELDGAEVLWRPELNQGLVRFLDRTPHATAADHDLATDATITAINATGEAFFSGTTWNGKSAMRVSVVNWRTTDRDVDRTLSAIEKVLLRRTAATDSSSGEAGTA
jgi:glutamate/tyrosine decarboxylase-like PLP-dependent enzyme